MWEITKGDQRCVFVECQFVYVHFLLGQKLVGIFHCQAKLAEGKPTTKYLLLNTILIKTRRDFRNV